MVEILNEVIRTRPRKLEKHKHQSQRLEMAGTLFDHFHRMQPYVVEVCNASSPSSECSGLQEKREFFHIQVHGKEENVNIP